MREGELPVSSPPPLGHAGLEQLGKHELRILGLGKGVGALKEAT